MKRQYACMIIAALVTSATACVRRELVRTVSYNYNASLASDINALREATKPYQDVNVAVKAGYPALVKDCLIHEHHGAMGYHHVNPAYVDSILDITKPEILLYEKTASGAYQLNAVEFFVPYRLWPAESAAPQFMGQKLHHEDNLKIWYLHVWVWKQNTEGLFANFNPDVKCPEGEGKVYRPSGSD